MNDSIKNTAEKTGYTVRGQQCPVWRMWLICIILFLAGNVAAGDVFCEVAVYGGITDHIEDSDRGIFGLGAGYGLCVSVPILDKWRLVLHYRESVYWVDEKAMGDVVRTEYGYPSSVGVECDIAVKIRQVIPCIRQEMVRYRSGFAFADVGLSFLDLRGDGDYRYTFIDGGVDDGKYAFDEQYKRIYLGAGFVKNMTERASVLVYPSYNFSGFWDVSLGLHYSFVK